MQTIKYPTSRGTLILDYMLLGNDLIAILTGGEKHVGAVAVSTFDAQQKHASASVITLPGHLDDIIGHPISRMISKATGKNVVFITGIHFDNITREEIEEITAVSREMADKIISIVEGN
jgi:hypothetical protein